MYSIAIFLASIIVGAAILGAGFATNVGSQYLTQQHMAACWAPSVQESLNGLTTQEALTIFKQSFPDGMSKADQDAVSRSFSASIQALSFNSTSATWGNIRCSGALTYSYTRADGSKYQNEDGNVVNYSVHPGQDGMDPEMSAADFPSGIVTYTDDPNPPPAPVPPPTEVPAAASPMPPEVADYDQGHADRAKYEAWVNSLQGPEQQGAIFWAGQRSLTNPESCADGASDAFPDNPNSQSIFQNGCQESQDTLGPLDAKRKSDALYKAGWNAPLDSPGRGPSQNQ
jgi:hypothetical protein